MRRVNIAARQRPPSGILGHPAQIPQFVARADHAVVALQHVTAFPEGCILALHVAVRRGSLNDSIWASLLESHAGGNPRLKTTGTDLKFEVRFPDGSKATTADNAAPGWTHLIGRPDPLFLIETDRESTNNEKFYESDRRLWLWPLPPPTPFEFIVEWPSVGIDTTSTTLDGSAIVRAAERALPYWP